MNKKLLFITKIALVSAMAVSISGCKFWDSVTGMFSGKKDAIVTDKKIENDDENEKDSSKVLVYLGSDEEPVLTEFEFKKYLAQILKMYPQLSGAMDVDSLPPAFKKTFLSKIVDQKLIIREALSNNYADNAKFQKDLDDATKLLREHMLIQEFEKRLVKNINITESDIKAEYDKNKAKYVKTLGGVLTSGVQFTNQDDANKFMALVQGKDVKEFSAKGRGSAGKFRNFGRIDKDTQAISLPNEIKSNVAKVSKFPSVSTIKDGDNIWVVHFSDKKSSEHYAFDDIKGQIENQLKGQKFQGFLGDKMAALRKKYPVKIEEALLAMKKDTPSSVDASNNKGIAIAG